jgi:hypothetical protein
MIVRLGNVLLNTRQIVHARINPAREAGWVWDEEEGMNVFRPARRPQVFVTTTAVTTTQDGYENEVWSSINSDVLCFFGEEAEQLLDMMDYATHPSVGG